MKNENEKRSLGMIILGVLLFGSILINVYCLFFRKYNCPKCFNDMSCQKCIDKCDYTKCKNEADETVPEETTIEEETNVIKDITYNVSLKENWIESKASTKNEYGFNEISEGGKYQYSPDYLTLVNGIPLINGTKKSDITNVKKIYFLIMDYNHQFAFLTSDGDIYIGSSLLKVNKNGEYALNFGEMEKVKSTNKYKEVRIIKVENNDSWKSDDTIEIHFIGITDNNTRDLITVNYGM